MCDQNVLLAKYAERAERSDDMAEFMTARVQTGVPLNTEERDLFSAAFKSALSGRRQAVRVALSYSKNPEYGLEGTLAAGYRTKLDAEITQVCQNATTLLQNILLPNATDQESQTFYYKMTGDYYRYMAEFAEDAKKASMGSQATHYYNQGLIVAQYLSATHPTRLGLALNYSVFLHEVEGKTAEAIATAKGAFESGVMDANSIQDDQEKQEALLTLQLLQDNLALWE